MTPDELKERCTAVYLDLHVFKSDGGLTRADTDADVQALIALYREALAKGLEMAREGIGRRIDYYSHTRWVDTDVRDWQISEASACQHVCETLANTLKETP